MEKGQPAFVRDSAIVTRAQRWAVATVPHQDRGRSGALRGPWCLWETKAAPEIAACYMA